MAPALGRHGRCTCTHTRALNPTLIPPPLQELSASQQHLLELQQQVQLLNVAAAAKGIDLMHILSTAAEQQQHLAAAAQQQLLAAAAATASKGLELSTLLSAAAAQQQQVSASAQQQLLAAAAAAAAAGTPLPVAPSLQAPLQAPHSDAAVTPTALHTPQHEQVEGGASAGGSSSDLHGGNGSGRQPSSGDGSGAIYMGHGHWSMGPADK